MKNSEEFCPSNPKEWRKWLELNHRKKDAVWLVLYKKKSPGHNLSWSESVDEALCFGWIDSTKKTIDHEKYKQYFSRRKAKSNWSKINKEKVNSLIEKGLMEEAGYQSVALAKENGSWTILDDVEALVVPDDLAEELAKYEGAKAYFDGRSKSLKKMLLHWLVSAKRKETRQKRIFEIARHAQNNSIPKAFRQTKNTP